MCYEPKGLWVVELTGQNNVKTMILDADTKITNICLNHELASRVEGRQSSLKLMSNGHAGTVCTLTPGKVEQALTDILLPKGAKILLKLVGPSAVFVTGYRIQSICVGAGNIKPTQRGSDGTAPHPSAETMAPPSVPLKRSSGSFSNPNSHPTTDHRRAGPAQIPTLPPSSKTKRPTPFTFKIPFTSKAPMSFTFSPSSWPTEPTVVHADPSPVNPLPVPPDPQPPNLNSIPRVNTPLREERHLASDIDPPNIPSSPVNSTAAPNPQPDDPLGTKPPVLSKYMHSTW